MVNLNVAVIGAGPWGLCAAKSSLQQDCKVTVYERNEAVGGTWRYIDETGKDKYGLNIHSAMYKGLKTNTPVGVIEFSDFPFPLEDKSEFAPYADVLAYYESYADHFDLKKHIKFSHNVVHVLPTENEKWEMIVKDLVNNTFETIVYDVVLIASGLFSTPYIPEIEDASDFKGKVVHSHDFRDAERYRDERILLIGKGASGLDIVEKLEPVAKILKWSGRKNIFAYGNIHSTANVKRFTATGAEFVDGTHETFSVIIYATGYSYKFPFLSSECGIQVDDNYMYPLYKQIINIEHPTMAFFGNPPIHEIEVQFALKFIIGGKKLPSKHEMIEEVKKEYIIARNRGVSRKNFQVMNISEDFLNELIEVAEIPHEKVRWYF